MVLNENIVTALYIAASVLFILSLGGLSGQESAKRAVWYGIAGMGIAVVGTIFSPAVIITSGLLPLLVGGAVIGSIVAMRVEMTGMPQLVAALHSFVGLAAVFIGINSDIMPPEGLAGAEKIIHEIEIFVGVFIGAITFTGSVVAYGKLSGVLDGKPLTLPGRNLLNIGMVLVSLYLGYLYMSHAGPWTLWVMTAIALVFGLHMVLAIGGADMPVVVSMLNSYSGWAAAATGFLLGNDLLIVTGALVGASGAILSYIMCKAMNRNFISVIFGGWGTTTGPQMEVEGEMTATDVAAISADLKEANDIIIVPGYGMAVAQAQSTVSELTRRLREHGKTGSLCNPPCSWTSAWPYECAAC